MRRLATLAATLAVLAAAPATASASSGCPPGSTLAIVAHPDDSILFLSPDVLRAIATGRCVRTAVLTAGDNGLGPGYWKGRERGLEAAYALAAGRPDRWTAGVAPIPGHHAVMRTLAGDPRVTIVFLRLPDGEPNGLGNQTDGWQSLRKLYAGQLARITAVDGSSSYTRPGLTRALAGLMRAFAPGRVSTQNFTETYGPLDHADHLATAYFARDAWAKYDAPSQLVAYMDDDARLRPMNVTGFALRLKTAAWKAYARDDPLVCAVRRECPTNVYWRWVASQYIAKVRTRHGRRSLHPSRPEPTVAQAPRRISAWPA